MTIDYDRLAQTHRKQYAPAAHHAYGNKGVESLKGVQRRIRDFYNHVVAPERLRNKMIFVRPVSTPIDNVLPGLTDDYEEYATLRELRRHFDPPPEEACLVQVCLNGCLRFWKGVGCSEIDLSRQVDAVVYSFNGDYEHFVFNGSTAKVDKIVPGAASMLAVPTYRDLKQALLRYRTEIVRSSSCVIFKKVWNAENRVLLTSRPEQHMRDSLCQFLRNRMRDIADIQRESNTDESKPVDLEVTWFSARRLAIIEIKWLGKSVSNDGGITKWTGERTLQVESDVVSTS